MSDFFTPPPPPSEPEPEPDFSQPPWFGPPHGTLPGVVALELVLAQSKMAAVYILALHAYPTGFGFDLMTVAGDRGTEELDPMLFGPHRRGRRRRDQQEGLDPEMLLIGVQFSDGAKATNVGGFAHDQDPPAGLVMNSGGGGGGGGTWHQTQWVWPLPPPGPVSFVCEWPAAQIALTRSEIDAQAILDAAARAQDLFPDQGPGHNSTLSTISAGYPQPINKPAPQAHSE